MTNRQKHTVIVADATDKRSLYAILDKKSSFYYIATPYYDVHSQILAHVLLILGIRNLKSVIKADYR